MIRGSREGSTWNRGEEGEGREEEGMDRGMERAEVIEWKRLKIRERRKRKKEKRRRTLLLCHCERGVNGEKQR